MYSADCCHMDEMGGFCELFQIGVETVMRSSAR